MNVVLIPLPAPLLSSGREFMTAVVFGAANSPLPIPFIKRIPSNCHKLKLYGRRVKRYSEMAVIIIPVVAKTRAPYLSVRIPPIGPRTMKPTINGSM